MPFIQVCALREVREIAGRIGARDMITLLSEDAVRTPPSIAAGRHLHLRFDDIAHFSRGFKIACEDHIASALAFGASWDRKSPMLIHCFHGMGRSPAVAYLLICAANPGREPEVAGLFRKTAPFITPNRRVLELGARILNCPAILEAAKVFSRPSSTHGEPFIVPINIGD